MARPQRFPRKLEFWTSDTQGDAIDRLEASGLLNRADHLRQAVDYYLRALAPPRPVAPNGEPQHQEVPRGL
jgi:hypothetical protein